MAIKKSELYSTLWASCDELRGGMDASQYKDYVLVMLFLKYISDKWAGQKFTPITIPKGSTFQDMVALKGKSDIGDLINKKIVEPIATANKLSDMPDFNDVNKLGSGKEMVDRLTNLIAIFENKNLDFSNNRAENDDILGDAYEYLMRHFATESGKSKGQFYTPAEVSRIMAKIIGIGNTKTTAETTVYDPTCGSGSLLLKVSGEASSKVTLYGQEKDSATSGLARMNMILHDYPTAVIKQANTLANPLFKENDNLKTFDFVVANPPFSDKRWSNGLTLPDDNPYNRFADYGVPPNKNGDYAFLLHIVRSLKRNGKGAIILPHGVLFRGNAEAEIRKNLIKKGYIKGIIGLPANLFYGTGIPAALILIDKQGAKDRDSIFIIDAGKDFIKDGNKNRLREQDIHKIADVFNNQEIIPGYSKLVSVTDIEKNEYNLNIPRYIANQDKEDLQDIEAHLLGGIPDRDVSDLSKFWEVYPSLRKALFSKNRKGYVNLKVDKDAIKDAIFTHPEFMDFSEDMATVFSKWHKKTNKKLKALEKGFNPKSLIKELSGDLLKVYQEKALIDEYDMYQHLMDYWDETMQDDVYIISGDGWVAETYRIIVEGKNGKKTDKGWACDLVPKDLVINKYFSAEQKALDELKAEKETLIATLSEMEEEQGGEDGYFAELEKVNKGSINARIKELKLELKSDKASSTSMAAEPSADYGDDNNAEMKVLKSYATLLTDQTALNKKIKTATDNLDDLVYERYPSLTTEEVKTLVIQDKWLAKIQAAIQEEIDHISQQLTNRVKELAERYESTLSTLDKELASIESKVIAHLNKMGFEWN